MTIQRRTWLKSAVGFSLAMVVHGAPAQAWPAKPVRIIIPYSTGGPTDAIGRVMAQEMARVLGQPFVVESKPGAGGTIGTGEVARSSADGYTLLMNPSVHVTYPGLYKKLAFDPMIDFEPVGLLGTVPMVAVVPTSAPYRTLRELIEFGKAAKPGVLSFASPGQGSLPHLAGELLNGMEGLQMTHVAYKGSAPAITDLVGGHVSLMFAPLATALPLIQGGKLRPLAVTTAARLPSVPDAPTFTEAGIKAFDASTWYGLWAPKGTPAPVVERLNAALRRAAETDAVKRVFRDQGTESNQLTAAQFADFATAENRRWLKVMRDAKVQPE